MKKLFLTNFFMAFVLLGFYKANSQVIFSENFSSSSFTTNGWTFPSGQGNWTIGAQYTPTGAASPNAFFNWSPTLTSYSHELLSPLINATSFTGGSVFLSYKLHLNNFSNATVENFAVEYKSAASPSWFTLTTYTSASVAPGLPFNISPTNVVLPSMAGTNFQIRFRAFGPNSFNINGWGLDDIQVLALNPCTGIPEAGVATAVPNNPCPGLPITLDLDNDSVAGGLLYQWQRNAPPSTAWINIGTVNPLVYTPPLGSTTIYRCIVSCSATGFSDTSGVSGGVVVQTFSPTSTCYCTPTNLGSACITNVTFGTLNNTTPGCTGVNNYNFYTTPIPSFVQGNPATFSITTDVAAITSVWIDYNHNTTFETTEWQQIYTNASSGSITFPIPNTSAIGQTRMRVRSRLPSNPNGATDACIPMGSGETEDYIINITPAGPFDPTITAITAPIGNTCTDSFQTLSATVYNFGSSNINIGTHPMNVVFTVNGPAGINTYTVSTASGGVTGTTYPNLSPFGASSFLFTINNVNLYGGGVYSINAKVTCPTLTNASLLNDSLANTIIITNYRPVAGPPYPLCQYLNTPFGQGLTVSGCTAPIYDSVEINFNLTTTIDNLGAIQTGTTLGPNNANCNNAYAGNFGNVMLPTLPLGSYFTKKALLTVNHLATDFPSEIRFILYTGSPTPPTLWAGCVTGYPGPVGDTALVGVSNPQFGIGSTNVTNYRFIDSLQIANIFDTTLNPSKTLNVGYWESFNDLVGLSDITSLNSGGTTTAKLKVYYQYVPPAYAWYDVPTGGTSLYPLSPFDPLSYPNAIVNNANVPGTYTFYAACLGLTNCRIPVDFVINPTPQVFQDTLLTCEFAVGSNNGIFNLHDADSVVSGGLPPGIAISYRGDQALLSPIQFPYNDTSSTNYVYSVVEDTVTGCRASDSVYLVVNSIPQFSLPIYANGQICAPNSVDISNVINVFPGIGLDTLYFENTALSIPYAGNPHVISTADTVYMIVVTNDGTLCADTAEAQISIGAATNYIANQDITSNTSITGGIPCSIESMGDVDTVTAYTSDCRRIATVIDNVADGDSLGNVDICEEIYNTAQVWGSVIPQPYVKRTYEITPANNDSAIVCLYYLKDDFDDYDAVAFPAWPNISPTANLCITKVHGGPLGSLGSTAVSIPSSAITSSFDPSTEVWTVCFPIDSFSHFYCHTCNPANAPLPVQLTTFTGTRMNEVSLLKWETSSELNNSHFVLERAKDAKAYIPISGKITSKGLNGTSQVLLKYEYTDIAPLSGHNYYRLRQVDIDGHESYSGTVDLFYGDETMVNVYPNPVSGIMNIDIQTPKVTNTYVKILDATGKLLRTIETKLQAGNNHIKLDVETLADGVYMLTVSNNKGLHFTKVISKK